MQHPNIKLPKQCSCKSVMPLFNNVKNKTDNFNVSEICFDFTDVKFIRPGSVVFLFNFINFLLKKDMFVYFDTRCANKDVLEYLDDSLFFENVLDGKLFSDSAPRLTTIPLKNVRHDESHAWLRMDLVSWFSKRLDMSENSFYSIQSCLSELFNNIKDHTANDIGCIFAQHYPHEEKVEIAIADFGDGIPSTVRTIKGCENLPDDEAILRSVENGFTSKSTPRNRGAGLDTLLKVVVEENKGTVTIYSRHGIVSFDQEGQRSRMADGFCQGTVIEISLRTDGIVRLDEDDEKFEWGG